MSDDDDFKISSHFFKKKLMKNLEGKKYEHLKPREGKVERFEKLQSKVFNNVAVIQNILLVIVVEIVRG